MNDHTLNGENAQVLMLVQPLIGRITCDILAVLLDFNKNVSNVYFVVKENSSQCREQIEDIIFEYESLQDGSTEVVSNILECDTKSYQSIASLGRFVFQRKE